MLIFDAIVEFAAACLQRDDSLQLRTPLLSALIVASIQEKLLHMFCFRDVFFEECDYRHSSDGSCDSCGVDSGYRTWPGTETNSQIRLRYST